MKQATELDQLAYSVDVAAKLLGLGRNTVLKLIQTGQLRHKRVRRRVIVPRSALEEFLDSEEKTF